MRTLALLTTSLVLAGCGPFWFGTGSARPGPDTALPWPPGLEPLAPYALPFPEGTDDEPFPERIDTARSGDVNIPAVHGRGYVHAPFADVWAALQRPEVLADRRRVASTASTPDPRPGFDTSFRLLHRVEDLVTFEFAVDWWMSRVDGTDDVPTFAAARSALVARNEFMYEIDVHLAITEIDDAVTAIQVQRHTRTLAAGEPEARSYVEDLFASIEAAAKGKPLPSY